MSRVTFVDYLVIGGGFYGCSLALFLRSVSKRIVLAEAGDNLMDRASRVNQARVHTGFHYPRSALTAAKSMVSHRRFAKDFRNSIKSDFQMLYAIASRRSNVSAKRFFRMFEAMGAPIAHANPSQSALFDPNRIEATFACTEYAFDFSVLRRHMAERIGMVGIDLRMNARVEGLEARDDGVVAHLASGDEIHARYVFNVTYSQTNAVLRSGGLPEVGLKHELTEIALIRRPAEMQGCGITIMDGAFVSAMPYPSEDLYSLTHVRYTPHISWTDAETPYSAHEVFARTRPESRHRHMLLDGERYVPCLSHATWVNSMYEVKTVLLKNEKDDGRPILYQRQPRDARVISIVGGKIDNIYDLFDLVRLTQPEWAAAHDGFVYPGPLRNGVAA
jgi:glycine/D-amino acid oxidase-like deaminating enzyme